MSYFSLLRPFLHALDPEVAHRLAIGALARGVLPCPAAKAYPALRTEAFGLSFPSPIGLAAGFDKNAECYNALLAQGFSFVEVGTVTPRPQPGNPRPRLFRLRADEAIINRLGFPGDGMEAVAPRLMRRDRGRGIVGVNIGKNKDSANALEDYVTLMKAFSPLADYIAVNVSSPNTEGLRDLQQRGALQELLRGLMNYRSVPLLLKIAPDLSEAELANISDVALEMKIDGIIVSNTTISRPEQLRSTHRNEAGGLSGKPLMALSTQTLRHVYRFTQGKIPLIGVGGIASAEDAIEKIHAGATLVQLYTALIYQGFGVVETIKRGVADYLEREGLKSVSELVGTGAN